MFLSCAGSGTGRQWAGENMTEHQLLETLYDTSYVIHGRTCFYKDSPLPRDQLLSFLANNEQAYNVYFTKIIGSCDS